MTNGYRLPSEFETSRYRLRRVLPTDAEAIFEAYAADEEVTRYLGWRTPKVVAETEAFLSAIQVQWENGSGFPSLILDREEPGRLLGMVHPRCFPTQVQYGYVLRKEAWGQGCASEVLRWLVDHALAHESVFRAQAFCDVENPASARVMEKGGMTKEGILRRYFVHPNVSAEPRDCILYAKVR